MSARDEWQSLVKIFEEQRDLADPSPTEHVALNVVVKLLLTHQPHPDESHSSGWMCPDCWEIWPCDVYAMITGTVDDLK